MNLRVSMANQPIYQEHNNTSYIGDSIMLVEPSNAPLFCNSGTVKFFMDKRCDKALWVAKIYKWLKVYFELALHLIGEAFKTRNINLITDNEKKA